MCILLFGGFRQNVQITKEACGPHYRRQRLKEPCSPAKPLANPIAPNDEGTQQAILTNEYQRSAESQADSYQNIIGHHRYSIQNNEENDQLAPARNSNIRLKALSGGFQRAKKYLGKRIQQSLNSHKNRRDRCTGMESTGPSDGSLGFRERMPY